MITENFLRSWPHSDHTPYSGRFPMLFYHGSGFQKNFLFSPQLKVQSISFWNINQNYAFVFFFKEVNSSFAHYRPMHPLQWRRPETCFSAGPSLHIQIPRMPFMMPSPFWIKYITGLNWILRKPPSLPFLIFPYGWLLSTAASKCVHRRMCCPTELRLAGNCGVLHTAKGEGLRLPSSQEVTEETVLPGPGPKCEAQSVRVISDRRGCRECGAPGSLMAESCCVSHSALWCPFADGFDVSESLEVSDKWSLWSPAEKLRKWWEMMYCGVGGQRANEAECQGLLRKLWCAGQTPVGWKISCPHWRLPGA